MAMTNPPGSANQANKVVVAFLDGRRAKGRVFNFSAIKESFDLFPPEEGQQSKAITVHMAALKAIFFVKDFEGNRERQGPPNTDGSTHGRKIEVAFRDGETILGTTDAYNPQKLGFFMFPVDSKTNNLRVFVVTKNVMNVRFV